MDKSKDFPDDSYTARLRPVKDGSNTKQPLVCTSYLAVRIRGHAYLSAYLSSVNITFIITKKLIFFFGLEPMHVIFKVLFYVRLSGFINNTRPCRIQQELLKWLY